MLGRLLGVAGTGANHSCMPLCKGVATVWLPGHGSHLKTPAQGNQVFQVSQRSQKASLVCKML